MHGGELFVQSQPGKGSMFSFNLSVFDESVEDALTQPMILVKKEAEPLASVGAQLAAGADAIAAARYDLTKVDLPALKSEGGAERIRVLAVDDDPVNLKVLVHILSADMYQIEMAFSAQEALDKLHREQWDLVIADVMMPGISGYALTRLIRERFTLYELPIILLDRAQRAGRHLCRFCGGSERLCYQARRCAGAKVSGGVAFIAQASG